MATALAIQYIDSANGGSLPDVTYVLGDASGMSFVNDGNTMVLIVNQHSSPLSVVFTSIADPYERFGDITVATTNGEDSITSFFPKVLWNQANHTVTMTIADATSLYLAAVSFI